MTVNRLLDDYSKVQRYMGSENCPAVMWRYLPNILYGMWSCTVHDPTVSSNTLGPEQSLIIQYHLPCFPRYRWLWSLLPYLRIDPEACSP